ncbi:hypothetical protein DE146DRAFT_757281 [Phaeosphaeria sp. MPI-PUGE-AT-0046c]|nr:hypothetical protein DE146DRAFT_757281 [Phaeosphaeria sp. MPI-PUGE-AT-0046c]
MPRQAPLSILLRSVGLDVLNIPLRKLLGLDRTPEPLKPIQTKSLTAALQRCAVHLLPYAFSVFLVTINLKGYYIGFELAGVSGKTSQYIALLQIAAKVQELLIVASLATVVVHRLRHDLIDGEGVPLGLVGASSLFSQLSYFWSTAFIGSVSGRPKLNATLVCLLLVSGLIAATVGPAIAVLLVPREQTWPAGGTKYWINGTMEDLWPSQVGLEHYMPDNGAGKFGVSCSSTEGYKNALCPAGGYYSLWNRYSSSDYYRPWSGMPDSRYTPTNLLIWSPQGQVPPYSMISAQRARVALESSAIGVHGPTSWAAAMINDDWQAAVDALPNDPNSRFSRYRYYSTMSSIIETQVPTVRVICSDLQRLVPRQRILQFPVVKEFGPAIWNRNPYLTFDDDHIGEPRELHDFHLPDGILENLRYTPHPRVSHVDLANTTWTTATAGIIVERSWSSINETYHKVSACIVDARWAEGAVSVGLGQPVEPEVFYVTKAAKIIRKALISFVSYRSFDMFRSDEGAEGSVRRIYITPEWFEAVNIPIRDGTNSAAVPSANSTSSQATIDAYSGGTTVSSLLALRAADTFLIPAIEHTLATVFADALARAGSWRVLNVTQTVINKKYNYPEFHKQKEDHGIQLLNDQEAYEDPHSTSANTFTEFHMRQEIGGYSFMASSITDILSLVVVFSYLAIATGHMLLLLIRRNSSSCWDSVSELLSLTQQSSPSAIALKNTAAGIERMSTFRQRARITVSENDPEHVEMRFDGDCEGKNVLQRPSSGLRYG